MLLHAAASCARRQACSRRAVLRWIDHVRRSRRAAGGSPYASAASAANSRLAAATQMNCPCPAGRVRSTLSAVHTVNAQIIVNPSSSTSVSATPVQVRSSASTVAKVTSAKT